jgi:hypothetical protein
MSSDQITKEQARVSLENYLVQKAKEKASTLKIEDYIPGDLNGVYTIDKIKDCFIVYVPDDNHLFVGSSHIIVISKETGEILADQMVGE